MKVERMNKLEDRIDELKVLSINELAKLNYSLQDIDFILKALLMPLNEIVEYLAIYDTSRPRIDELKFINDISVKYHTDTKNVLKRIRETRRIKKYRDSKQSIKSNSFT